MRNRMKVEFEALPENERFCEGDGGVFYYAR